MKVNCGAGSVSLCVCKDMLWQGRSELITSYPCLGPSAASWGSVKGCQAQDVLHPAIWLSREEQPLPQSHPRSSLPQEEVITQKVDRREKDCTLDCNCKKREVQSPLEMLCKWKAIWAVSIFYRKTSVLLWTSWPARWRRLQVTLSSYCCRKPRRTITPSTAGVGGSTCSDDDSCQHLNK